MGTENKFNIQFEKIPEVQYNYNRFPGIRIYGTNSRGQEVDKKYGVWFANSGSFLGNCGTMSFTGAQVVEHYPVPTGPAYVGGKLVAPKKNEPLKIGIAPSEIYNNSPELFVDIQQALISQSLTQYLTYNYMIAFGGRVGYTHEAYIGMWGVHSGSIGKYIKDNKLGTITMSHLHHNSGHSRTDDYSVQQVFLWSPPKQVVMPVKKAYCGIFGNKEERLQGFEKEMKRLDRSKKWALFYPNYAAAKYVKEERLAVDFDGVEDYGVEEAA